MIGIKGAPQGTVPEVFSKSLMGPAVIDTSKFVQFMEGTIQFPPVTNVVKWLDVIKEDSIPSGASINYFTLAYQNNGSIDTLTQLNFIGNNASIEMVDTKIYSKISILSKLYANASSISPEIKSIGVNFVPLPELAINSQVVSVDFDTIMIGQENKLKFWVYNVGKSIADSILVKVEIINADNSRETIYNQIVDSLESEQNKYFEVSYKVLSGLGTKSFLVNIDSENKVSELYEDNNVFSIPFFVEADSTIPSVNLTIDGYEIIDGDYISQTPDIQINLFDESQFPITDTSSVRIYLNDRPVFYADNPSILTYRSNTQNPKFVVNYKPQLNDGEYRLKVFGKNSFGTLADSAGMERYFTVSMDVKLLEVYNFPNPFANETYFTFKLTQIPEYVKIKIFTIAGRLIKEIYIPSSGLKSDFNKIYWDGKDGDGDNIANGTYLYKMILKDADKVESVNQKLVIMK